MKHKWGKMNSAGSPKVVFSAIEILYRNILDMADTMNSRQKMLERARERFPDRTFADLDATEPQEGVANLDDAINEILEDYSSRQATYDENDNKLKKLLVSDPSSAEFIQRWVETGDPRTALVETFGEDLGIAEEKAAEFRDQLEGWRARKAENDALNAEAEANWDASLAALEEWGNAKGLSLEQKRDVMVRLLAIVAGGIVNKYGVEDFELAYNAINHDTDVAAARTAGEIAGRNERIAATRRNRATAQAMPPAVVGGQGARTQERKPVQSDSPWANVK